MADDEVARRAQQRVSDAEREKVAERVRTAAADGRLGLDELDERLGSALAARTRAELDAVVDDLDDGVDARRADGPMVIRTTGSPVSRTGRWEAPARIVVVVSTSSIVLDFTEATFAAGRCRIELELAASALRVVVPEGVAAEADVESHYSSIDVRVPGSPAAPRAVIEIVGTARTSSVSVRRPGWRRRRQLRRAARAIRPAP